MIEIVIVGHGLDGHGCGLDGGHATFSPIEPGTYQLPNFGVTTSIDIPDGWELQPNFPGIVAMTKLGSQAPGDRDIVFLSDVSGSLTNVAGGPTTNGAPGDLPDLLTLLKDPPDGLELTNIKEMTLAGNAVTRFDIAISSDVSCAQDDPCEYAISTNWGFVKMVTSTAVQRIWWFDDHPDGRAMIMASGHNTDFINDATTIVESMQDLS